MSKTYAILGAGMQGTAAAYDLAKFADANRILMGDVSLEQAEKACQRVNKLTGKTLCEAHAVDALSEASLETFLRDADIILSCVPYWMHPKIAHVAIANKTHFVDLGGNTDITLETLKLDQAAQNAGVTVVSDTGLAPGLVNSLGLWLIEQMDEVDSVKLYCGVLPQHPKPPFNYKLTFNIEGLVTEYDFEAVVLRNGEIVKVPTLAETEELTIDELGPMEAFTTSGGTSTAPYTLKGRVKNYEYKTIRHPGHGFLISVFRDTGFWGREEVDVCGVPVRPLDVWHKVFGKYLDQFTDNDLCAVRAVGVGKKGGQDIRKQIDIFDRQCEETGFTSMERLTGFSMAIYAIDMAEGKMPAGCLRYENAMTGTRFVDELQRRGIQLKFS